MATKFRMSQSSNTSDVSWRDMNAVTSNLKKAKEKWEWVYVFCQKRTPIPGQCLYFTKPMSSQSYCTVWSYGYCTKPTPPPPHAEQPLKFSTPMRPFHNGQAYQSWRERVLLDKPQCSRGVTLNNAGILPIEEYIQKPKNTITSYAQGRAIYA